MAKRLYTLKKENRLASFRKTLNVLGLLLCGGAGLNGQERTVPITPMPQEVAFTDRPFVVNRNTEIVLGLGTEDADLFTATIVNSQIERSCGFKLKVTKRAHGRLPANTIYFGNLTAADSTELPFGDRIDLDVRVKIGDQGYFLQSSDSLAMVIARTSQGLYYGAESLLQLMNEKDQSVEVAGVRIVDWPAIAFRGASDDLSKGQVPLVQKLEEKIRFLAQHKINAYMPYLGTRFQFENLSAFSEGQSAISERTIRELQDFAREYHVQIIPAIETLSNLDELLRMPEHRHLAEFPGASSITPLIPGTYQLLDEMIFELSETFEAPYLHVGGGMHQIGWQASAEILKDRDLSAVLVEHITRVHEIAQKYGKQVMLDGDYFGYDATIALQLPADVIVLDPNPNGHNNFQNILTGRGIPSFSSIDFTVGKSTFPDYLKIGSRIQGAATATRDEVHPEGALLSFRNTGSGYTFDEHHLYGYAFAAECTWSPRASDLHQFNQLFFGRFFGESALEVELIYSLLSDLEKWSPSSRIWRHPFAPTSVNPLAEDTVLSRLRPRMQQALNLIDSAAGQVREHGEHLGYLSFAAKHGLWLAAKMKVVNAIQNFEDVYGESLTNGSSEEIVSGCLALVEDLNQIQEELQLLWIRNYSVESISQVLDLYTVQVDYWQEIIDDLQRGQLDLDPTLESEWIYHPDSEENALVRSPSHAFFRKTFEVTPGFRKAYMQVISDAYAKVYLNGGFLDDVLHFSKGSLFLRNQNVKTWDITHLLQPGKNVIALEVWNHHPSKPAGANVFGGLDYEFGRFVPVASDSYWKTSIKTERGWQNLGFFDVQWLNPVTRTKDLTIIQPNFKTSRPSQVEFPAVSNY